MLKKGLYNMAAKKNALGKGIDALIPKGEKSVKSESGDSEAKVMVKITEVEPNKEQPRRNFDEDALLELSESIKQFGILVPLLVQKREGYYEIIAGERRWRAAKMANIKEVPVIIMDLTPQQIVEISLIENIQREDLNPIEEAMAFKRLLEEFNLKQDEVAERVSKSRTAVANSIRLLKLNSEVQQMVIDEMITTGHARALLSLDQEKQLKTAQKIFDEKLSVRETERLVKRAQEEKKEDNRKAQKEQLILLYKDICEQLKSALGTKVSIVPKDEKAGRMEIEYYSAEDLDKLVHILSSSSAN